MKEHYSEEERQSLTRRILAGESLSSIAKELGTSYANVYYFRKTKWFHRIKDQLEKESNENLDQSTIR